DHQRVACIGGNQGNGPGPRTSNSGDATAIDTARLLRSDRDGGDNGSMPPDLDACVKALEARTSEIGVDVRAVIKDVAEIKGKISQMPTTFRMQAWFVGVSLGLVALVFAVARALR